MFWNVKCDMHLEMSEFRDPTETEPDQVQDSRQSHHPASASICVLVSRSNPIWGNKLQVIGKKDLFSVAFV